MTAKDKLYKILHLCLIEIRAEANEFLNEKEQNEQKIRKIFAISHLVHNLPNSLHKENPDYNKILEKLIERAEYNNKELARFLKNNI